MTITDFSLEVRPCLPAELERLPELAENLLYSWNTSIRALFLSLDRELWASCHHNPKLMLRWIDQATLERAAKTPEFIQQYHELLEWYDSYCSVNIERDKHGHSVEGLVAYFCAEFGLHESFPIYSGGLGILAGDHCKAASDLALPLVAVGLLYQQSISRQIIDAHGEQHSQQVKEAFDYLPVTPARDENGNPVIVTIMIVDRLLRLKVWQAKIGRVSLYLLDSDLPANLAEDRVITQLLYGGGKETRILQEMVLGIGGVKALRALGLEPEAWHINEGHAAFIVIERIIEMVQSGVDFQVALERVAAGTIFTIHTPIAAGHDIFDWEMVRHFLGHYLYQAQINPNDFGQLGRTLNDERQFSMTSLALRGSRFHNGVSRIHGQQASVMEQHIWPQIPAEENPMGYVTNGVHVDTFLDKDWQELLKEKLPDWRTQLQDPVFWEQVDSIADDIWWNTHINIKQTLLKVVCERLTFQHRRNGLSEALIEKTTSLLRGDAEKTLVIGFARRFATYKRATLLFQEMARLTQLLTHNDRPVIILFAGNAHSSDEAGKALIRQIHQLSMRPDLIGRVIMLEGYNMALARRMVAGCDIWLNTPRYPLEACGTSGQKAAMNGVVNLSIKDGWWGEGYNGKNGWAVSPHVGDGQAYCDQQEAIDILDILEHQVFPAYFDRKGSHYPAEWIRYSKASMKSVIGRFSSWRMVSEYRNTLYAPAIHQQRLLASNDNAEQLAAWKTRVRAKWRSVKVEYLDMPITAIFTGETLAMNIKVKLNGLSASDIAVDCLFGSGQGEAFRAQYCMHLRFNEWLSQAPDSAIFTLEWQPAFYGLKHYRFRVYPHHPLLAHPFEMGCMLWV